MVVNKGLLQDAGGDWNWFFESVGKDAVQLDVVDHNLVDEDEESASNDTALVNTKSISERVRGPVKGENERDQAFVVMEGSLGERGRYMEPPKGELDKVVFD